MVPPSQVKAAQGHGGAPDEGPALPPAAAKVGHPCLPCLLLLLGEMVLVERFRCCFGIKPAILVAASALENWDVESNSSSAFLEKKHELLKPRFYFPITRKLSFMSFPELHGELWC